MKVGIVKLSTIKKYNRLDPQFYLGNSKRDTTDQIAKLEREIEQKKQRIVALQAEMAFENCRIQRMIDSGEVRVIPNKEKP